MSYVSAALTASLDALGWKQTALSELAGVDRAMLNRYTRGAVLGADNLEKLVKVLPTPHNAELVAAYVRDTLPASVSGLVAILSQSSVVKEGDQVEERLARTVGALDADLKRDVVELLERAARQPAIGDMLRTTAAVLRGD